MRALTVDPTQPNSLRLSEIAAPEARPDELLVETLVIGVCGTDREIVEGGHGEAPQGESRLVLGHEVLGRVLRTPANSSFKRGDLVVGIVRRPDPEPCPSCAAGEWDMCQNGRYTERGIKGAHGYGSEVFALEQRFAIIVPEALRATGVLLEPTSVVAKAWEQIDYICTRLHAYSPRQTLITGAGPIGLLAALLAVQRGHRVTVMDRAREGIKPQLVRELGAAYCTDMAQLPAAPEIVVECTGDGGVVIDALAKTARNGIVCLTGLSSGRRAVELSATALNNTLVLENDVVFGSVNANHRHYIAALTALERATPTWLERLITRRLPIERFGEVFARRPDEVKVVLEWHARAHARNNGGVSSVS